MEPELSSTFWVKMIATNIVLRSPVTYFMHMRVKTYKILDYALNFIDLNFRSKLEEVENSIIQWFYKVCDQCDGNELSKNLTLVLGKWILKKYSICNKVTQFSQKKHTGCLLKIMLLTVSFLKTCLSFQCLLGLPKINRHQ